MPTVTKHTSNNLVTVAYQVRESVLDITHAEHALILADGSSQHKINMIKFIRGQYNLGLYDAKQVVDTVIEANEKLQTINKYTIPETDWSKVDRGTWISVRDFDTQEWASRQFFGITESKQFPFSCYASESGGIKSNTYNISWKYAELSNN